LKTTGFNTSYAYDCGWKVSGPITAGECQMWGNPIAEMMYEGIRYFAGKKSPTSAYSIAFGDGEESELPGGGLPVASWDDPYASAPSCSKPFETVISDINPSYDSDKLPGSAFNSFSGDLNDLDVSKIGQTIWDNEMKGSKTVYIGRSLSDGKDDKAPTPKNVTSFGNIRGLAPEEPTKEGSYYAASVAYYGLTHDVNPKAGDQKVSTFAVALASPLPRIEIPIGDKKITLVPFAKTVGGSVNGSNVLASSTDFQPTNQIVDFYVDELDKTHGKFRVNYEDVEQGADHDMDAIVQYEYTVKSDGTVDITLTSQYAAGSLIQHIGYVISGTTHDGIYFEVRDTDTDKSNDPDYYLDTPTAFTGTPPAPSKGQTGTWDDDKELPLSNTRNFTPGATGGAEILKDPLWYAAKWGGFQDQDKNDIPNLQAEWDENKTGDPSNYFLVTNALTLPAQLAKAFNEIIVRTSAAASASVNSGSVSSDTRVYQAKFNSGDWTGQLLSFPLNTDGTLKPYEWDAATKLPAPTDRVIITTDTNANKAVPFRWASIGANRQAQLDPASGTLGSDRIDYLRGDDSKETTKSNGTFRKRASKLGDIVNSSPIFVGAPPFRYTDATYAAFRTKWASRTKMVYVGANDGMLHGFDATSGAERLAFVPGPVFRNLAELTKPGYAHRFFVDGTPSMADVYYNSAWHTVLIGGLNKGGQGVYALDITDPANFTEANATSVYKWEFTDTNDADLGYTYSRPAIAQFRSPTGTQWLAVFGNGYNSTFDDTALGGKKSSTGNAVLFFLDVETGKVVAKIDTKMGAGQDPTGNSRPNGLATPTLVDTNGDGVVDYVFAGDLFGEMWKFNVTAADPTSWGIAFGGVPMFVAKDATGKNQPITSRAEVGRGPGGKGMVVLFGTGKFLEPSDKILANLSTQSFYGLFDPNTASTITLASDRSTLTQQQITYEGTNTVNGKAVPLRAVTQNAVAAGFRGWYLDLVSAAPGVPSGSTGFKGEMQVSDPILRNGRVIFSTIIPSTDPCTFGGNSWLMTLDALSGGRLSYPPFDLNNDHVFDKTDFVTLSDGTTVPASGMQWNEGMVGKPGVVAGQNEDFGYGSGSSGNDPEKKNLNTGPGDRGRQSWRQLR
jgi:type IV pilus assembly protein PilY1